jgi:predicted PurR-regulated permease PerM
LILAMMFIAIYFLLVQGDDLVSWLDRVSPFGLGRMQELLHEFRAVSLAVVVSSLITSAVQALAALLGFLVTGVPHPLFFAAVAFVFAFIPAVGAAAVCLSAAGILFLGGHPSGALMLAIWALFVVGLADNIVLPFLVKSGLHMNGGVILFALLGGIGAFGVLGIFLGPLSVTLFLALLRIYRRDFRSVETAPPKLAA